MDSELLNNLSQDILNLLASYGIVPNMETKDSCLRNRARTHGFKLNKKEKEGRVYFEVRYKDNEDEWLNTRKIIYTSDENEALDFAIRERDNIISEYKERKKKRIEKTDSFQLYKLLEEYYNEGSIYLQKDTNDNRKTLSEEKRMTNKSITKTYLIPFLQEKEVKTLKDITKEVYSDYKIYLQNKNISSGYINGILSALNRILLFCERYEYIDKLPYTKGLGRVILSQEEKERTKGNYLPITKMSNILTLSYTLSHHHNSPFKSKESQLLFAIGLTTGLRDSEATRIRVKDIKYVEKANMYLLYVNNHKIEQYTTKTEKYRKIPLHEFVVSQIEHFIKFKGKTLEDYLFNKKDGEDIKEAKDIKTISYSRVLSAITYCFIGIEIRNRIIKKSNFKLSEDIKEIITFSKEDIANIRKEMKEKNYHFYSFRHTLTTMLGLEKLNTDFIDYITGHLPEGKMRANYTHINSVDNVLFCREYGMSFLRVINKYFFAKSNENRELERTEALKMFLEQRKTQVSLLKSKRKNIFEII